MDDINYNMEMFQKELDILNEEESKRYDQIIENYGVPTGRGNEHTANLRKWYTSEVKKLFDKYQTRSN